MMMDLITFCESYLFVGQFYDFMDMVEQENVEPVLSTFESVE